jgi:DNA polymerase-3 subunit gamma/tau
MANDMDSAWAEKYRPRHFEQVVGQAQAVETLSASVRLRRHKSVVFYGPYGTGKTSLALLYGQAINCKEPTPSGSPCRSCKPCRYIEDGYRGDNFREYNSRTDVDLDEIRRLVEDVLPFRPWTDISTRVFFFDEAQALTKPVLDALLIPVERPKTPSVFLFVAIERGHLPPALLSRCTKIETKLLDEQKAYDYLQHLSRAEQLQAEPDALRLIAQVNPHARDLVQSLERVAVQGEGRVTVAGVQRVLINDRVARMVGYFLALAEGDLDAQLRLIAGSTLSPFDTLETIQEMLLYLRLRYVGSGAPRPSVLYRFLDLISEEDCQRIIASFRERAGLAGVPFEALFDEMLEFWAFIPALVTQAVLNIQLVRFHNLVNAHRAGAALANLRSDVSAATGNTLGVAVEPSTRDLTADSGSSRRFRRAPIWRRTRNEEATDKSAPIGSQDRQTRDVQDRLTVEQVRDLYEAATFLIQSEGVLFNTRITIEWGELGVSDDLKASQLMSGLAHELGLRLAGWGLAPATSFHRITLHEGTGGKLGKGNGLRSHLVGHLPDRHRTRVEDWVCRKYLPKRIPGAEITRESVLIEIGPSEPQKGHVARHWQLMRLLWRGLDESVTIDLRDGSKPALADVLKIPAQQRGEIGAVSCRRYAITEAISLKTRKEAAAGRMAHLSIFEDAVRYGAAAWRCLDLLRPTVS